ncbi:hypothetical protein F5X99DRAFT_371360 [Biscogniauxia marginata]|nr:hypothetical protein F5X99DRAFT_371360 [Biscogniauxia marginata]
MKQQPTEPTPHASPWSGWYCCNCLFHRIETSQLVAPMCALVSLSTAAVLGPHLGAFSGLPQSTILQSLHSTVKSDWLIPSAQQVPAPTPSTVIHVLSLQYYAATTLSLYKIRGNGRQRNLTSGVVLVIGLNVCLYAAGFGSSWHQKAAEVLAALPLLISLSLLFSAVLHTILDYLQGQTPNKPTYAREKVAPPTGPSPDSQVNNNGDG